MFDETEHDSNVETRTRVRGGGLTDHKQGHEPWRGGRRVATGTEGHPDALPPASCQVSLCLHPGGKSPPLLPPFTFRHLPLKLGSCHARLPLPDPREIT